MTKNSLKNSIKQLIGFSGVLGAAFLLASCGQPSGQENATSGATNGSDRAVEESIAQDSPAATPTGETASPNPAAENLLDEEFAVKAAQDNLFELQAGELASQQATNPEVQEFGQLMVQDHTQATQQLQQVASENQITLPTEMGEQNEVLLDRLSNLSGEEFDQAYMDAMVNSHQIDVALFQNQAEAGQDPELRDFAAQVLPNLEAHLQRAEDLQQSTQQ